MLKYLVPLLVFAAGYLGSQVAEKKGYNQVVWALLCALFPLLIVVLLVFPYKNKIGRTVKCRFCAEEIQEEAIVCKHCGRDLTINY